MVSEERSAVVSKEATEHPPGLQWISTDSDKNDGTDEDIHKAGSAYVSNETARKRHRTLDQGSYLDASAVSEAAVNSNSNKRRGAPLKHKYILALLSLTVMAISSLLVARCGLDWCVRGEGKVRGEINGKQSAPSKVISLAEGTHATEDVVKIKTTVEEFANKIVDAAADVEKWAAGCHQKLIFMFPVSRRTPGVMAANELLEILRNIEFAVRYEMEGIATSLHRVIESLLKAPPGTSTHSRIEDHSLSSTARPQINTLPLKKCLDIASNARVRLLDTFQKLNEATDIFEREANLMLWQEASLLRLATSLENQPWVLLNELEVLVDERKSLSSEERAVEARGLLPSAPPAVFSSLLQTEQNLLDELHSALLTSSPGLQRTGMVDALRETLEMQEHFVSTVQSILGGFNEEPSDIVLKKVLALRSKIAEQGAVLKLSVSEAEHRAKVEIRTADALRGSGTLHPLDVLAVTLEESGRIEHMIRCIESGSPIEHQEPNKMTDDRGEDSVDSTETSHTSRDELLQSSEGDEDLFIDSNGMPAGIPIDMILQRIKERRMHTSSEAGVGTM